MVKNRIMCLKGLTGDPIEELEKTSETCEQYYKEMYAPDELPYLNFVTV